MELPEDLQTIAREELHETPERRSEALAQLKNLLGSNPTLGYNQLLAEVAKTGLSKEQLLLQHLRARKFDAGKAYTSLCLRAAFLHDHPDLASNISGQEFLELYKAGFMRVLPGTDKLGRRVICLRPAHLTDVKVDPLLIRWQVWCMSRLARDPQFQVNGVVLINNFDSIKLRDAKFMAGQIKNGRMRLMFHYIRDCAPTRIGGIYFMNQPKFISIVWSLVSLFIGKKIRSRVRFLGSNLAALHDLIDPKDLSPILGSTLQQDNPLEWLEQQMQQQSSEVAVAAATKGQREAAVAAVSSWTIADEEELQSGDELGVMGGDPIA